MIVGAAVIELHVHDSQSLKAKRGVVRSILGRLRNRFNVSAAEVGGQGTWQRAVIGLSMSGSDEVALRRALGKAVEFVEGMGLAQVLDSEIELLRLPLEDSAHFDADGRLKTSETQHDGAADDSLPWNADADAAPGNDDENEERE